ncbi:hypothetical protein [Nocardia thailandica]|uniref:hypothetical protein n=1 Tax=Nocardia thailandica TaxID=257275 RepID=UPI0005B85028|nr:hypothetical protein [Nocardia thailandica]
MSARNRTWARLIVAGATLLAVGCATETTPPGIVAMKSLPLLAEYPPGYSLLGTPQTFTAADPPAGAALTFTDEGCRSLLENPVGAGARESVVSGTSPAVFLVQVVQSDQPVAGLTNVLQHCADIEATARDRTVRFAMSAVAVPATAATESVALRATGTQQVRAGEGQSPPTPVGQQRFVARVGRYVLSAMVMLQPPMSEQELNAETEVLRQVYEIAVRRLVDATR